ncbi:FAD-dependent oxidoreductase [Sporosarcina pasteurii]|uniref:Gamma-glutamylputrescine oxidoreductase n=1 Tax=Sporosarcina pasteurii TaxID=1474 RepID=A0A380CGP2_SPOPA|nr:FAD-dependent oxidoreductase [Sporosarcina pasteurii]MDS9472133.1 FAD-dependent oxidoreductase [Sporosarcina pasteurii]QBQ06848.1 FAD-dependent oxidoreductase [Sporosarcina pasteurii]SUJ20422.1 Gamma-glutamylputrescine oxidoreductase [Sporosarcina pasteurii]
MPNSLWLQSAYEHEPFPPLQEDIHCDVCIVGGGLSGIANAYYLAKQGKDVVLLEKDSLLAGATGNSTGKLTTQHDFVYANLINKFGREHARLYYDVNKDAVEFGRSIAKGDELLSANSILYAQTKAGEELLRQEAHAYTELSIPGELGRNSELPIPILSTLMMEDEAQIHPVRFGHTLAKLAIEAGARFYEQSDVQTMDFNDRFLTLKSAAKVHFKNLILSTHYPIEALKGIQVLKLAVDRSYIVSARADIALTGQYISVDSPKRSIRTAKIDGKTYFLLSGSSHTAGVEGNTTGHYERLYADLKDTFRLTSFITGWSAQDPETPDLIPYAGKITTSLPHVYISTGNRKWGLSNSLAGAKIISDQIVGRENPATALYAPNRTGFGDKLLQALKLTGLVVKEFTTGHIARTDAPICTHMGCRTRWNNAEETWDCPCHGSRFRKDGSVLEGPATKPLDLS